VRRDVPGGVIHESPHVRWPAGFVNCGSGPVRADGGRDMESQTSTYVGGEYRLSAVSDVPKTPTECYI
jgi:hypothetical protein